MAFSLAASPCPNDTFIFHALVHGLIPGAPHVDLTFADVDVTNTAAERGEFDLVKVSFAALPWLLDQYELLPCGGALGRGCGPLVLTRKDSGLAREESGPAREESGLIREESGPAREESGLIREKSGLIRGESAGTGGERGPARGERAGTGGERGLTGAEHGDLTGATVAVPGDRTTAYLLFRLWSADRPPARIEVVPFDRIMPGVADGTYDAGLVIHEARFTYPRHGLTALADLGEWWEKETGLPIPLGAILAKRGVVDPAEATEWIRTSLSMAWADPDASREFVLAHAQEMEPDVVRQHIGLYVNEFSLDLGDEGYAAADALLGRAAAAGLSPAVRTR